MPHGQLPQRIADTAQPILKHLEPRGALLPCKHSRTTAFDWRASFGAAPSCVVDLQRLHGTSGSYRSPRLRRIAGTSRLAFAGCLRGATSSPPPSPRTATWRKRRPCKRPAPGATHIPRRLPPAADVPCLVQPSCSHLERCVGVKFRSLLSADELAELGSDTFAQALVILDMT